jgi:hypothetical protein
MKGKQWARLPAYVTGLVNQELLLQNEYLAAENRVLRGRLPARLRLSDPGTARLPDGNQISQQGAAPFSRLNCPR